MYSLFISTSASIFTLRIISMDRLYNRRQQNRPTSEDDKGRRNPLIQKHKSIIEKLFTSLGIHHRSTLCRIKCFRFGQAGFTKRSRELYVYMRTLLMYMKEQNLDIRFRRWIQTTNRLLTLKVPMAIPSQFMFVGQLIRASNTIRLRIQRLINFLNCIFKSHIERN